MNALLTTEHSESANLCQGQNLMGDSFSQWSLKLGTYRLLVRPWNVLQGHRRWCHWTEHIRLSISVL